MINKKIIIISLLILILMSVQCVSASDNTDINLIGDNGDYGVLKAPTETQTYTDLKNLIDNDNTGEITLLYNYQYNNGDPKTGINITKDLVINGNGATINGQDASSLFNISSGVTVTLKNLTITHAAGFKVDSNPANCFHAINSQGNINIFDCTFSENHAGDEWTSQSIEFAGAAIFCSGNVNIQNSSFIDNYVHNYGGAIYTTGTLTLNNSYFSKNKAISRWDDVIGGAIVANIIDIIENCTFVDNTAINGAGGSIFILGDSVTTIKDSTFKGTKNALNSINGGAIFTYGAISLIENSTFEDIATTGDGGAIFIFSNTKMSIRNSTLKNLDAKSQSYSSYVSGGAIYTMGDVEIKNVTMEDNSATNGGVIYAEGVVTILDSYNINNNGNTGFPSTQNGGVVYARGDVTLENTTFGANYAQTAGGAIYSESNVYFFNSKVNGSAATSENGDGGFIYAKGNVEVENATISDVYMKVNDQNGDYSGAVYAEGDMIIRNATFDHINKEHHGYGGAIHVLGNVEIYNSNFTNNQAMLYAAGYVGGTLDIYDCIFTNNTNGAIFSEGNAVVNNTMFINNTIADSTMYGIAIGSNGTLNLTNSYVIGSNAQGANYMGSVFSKDNLYVENCTFDEIHSEAGTATGMIVSTKSNASVINSKFLDFSYHGSTIYGGSIYAGVNAYVENCTFYNATLINQNGQTHGLCIYAEQNISLYNSTLEDIDSSNGQNGAVKGGNYVYVFNSTFINITGARSSGGAIYANVANVTNSSFYRILCSDNADKGGAIYANDTYVYYNNFTNCHAGQGGAIFSLNYTTAIQNIFINNSNQYSGGAIYTKNGFIQYNVILENMGNTWNLPADIGIVDSEADSLEYNWWGENNPFNTSDKQKRVLVDVQSGQITFFLPYTWVRMHFFPTDNDQPAIGEGVNLTTTLKDYYNRTADSEFDLGHNIAKRTVIYKVNNITADEQVGWFSHDTAPIINQDYVLYSNNNFVKHNVSSTIDYQTLYLGVVQFYVNVTKTVTNLTPNVDDEITYTIKVNNTDTTNYSDPSAVIINPIKELNITITDKLDPRLKFVSANDTNYNPSTGEWFIENLAINGTISLNITVKVLKGGNITNYANVTKINDTVLTHPYGANVTIQVPLVYKLDVNKTVNKKEVVLGDTVTFTINVTNIGSGNLTTIVVNDTLPSGFKFISSDNPGYDNDTGLLIIDELKEEGSVVFHILAKTTAEGLLTNNVNATCNENQTLVKSSASVDVKPFVNLTVNKTVNVTVADVVLVGDKLKYTITVKNVGLSEATLVNVTDVVDTSLVEVVTGESSSGYGSVVANGWRIASLAPDAESTLYLVVKVIGNGTISNSVNVSCSENKTNVTNSSVDVDADPFVNLTVNKTVNVTEVVVGDKIK
ncbi:MAG: DUF11 domain-containing protein, partial [Methanobrevibacter sp.]|nr:DUF11 domain-containing protein [Methanobrevibacter sp.]